MRHSLRTGVSFGLTSGVITTLGLMVGLHAGTHSTLAVAGGILTIAIADAFSDALGIHITIEEENRHSQQDIWESTVMTFVAKFFVAVSFIVPVLLWSLETAIVASLAWGMALLMALSLRLAYEQRVAPWKVVGEHVAIALLVVTVTHYVGDWIREGFR
jgi:VIT1/CCC1 family predicted Fe2+/Mn2+ transporter